MKHRDAGKESEQEIFVKLLYEGILKRLPDKVGFEENVQILGEELSASSMLKMLQGFIESTEAKRLRSFIWDTPKWQSDEIPAKFIISIGSQCFTSAALQRSKLKRFSGPFDWIFSSMGMVADCIEDNFEVFLDRRLYRQIPPELRVHENANFCDHLKYQELYGISSIFNHSDPNDQSVYAYLCRSVDRFKRAISKGERCILFGVYPENRWTERDFLRLCNNIQSNKAVELYVVALADGGSSLEHSFKQLFRLGNHRIFQFKPTSALGPVNFENPFDDFIVSRLLDTIHFDLADKV